VADSAKVLISVPDLTREILLFEHGGSLGVFYGVRNGSLVSALP
jgi:hypothetical protein